MLFSLFGSDGNNIQYRCDALRPEPRYIIKEYRNYDERVNAVIEMIKYMPKPLIVYVIEPDIANKYCKKLRSMGFTNVFSYTGDTSDTDRELLLEKWKANEFDVMIATSAFGMGVDKTLIPNMKTRIEDALLDIPKDTKMSCTQFVGWIKENIPEAASACTEALLPLAVSNGLRVLNNEGVIELVSTRDAVRTSLYQLNGVELNDFSEIIIRGCD